MICIGFANRNPDLERSETDILKRAEADDLYLKVTKRDNADDLYLKVTKREAKEADDL